MNEVDQVRQDMEALVFDSVKGIKGRPVKLINVLPGNKVDTPFGHKAISIMPYGTEQNGAYVTPKAAPLEES